MSLCGNWSLQNWSQNDNTLITVIAVINKQSFIPNQESGVTTSIHKTVAGDLLALKYRNTSNPPHVDTFSMKTDAIEVIF